MPTHSSSCCEAFFERHCSKFDRDCAKAGAEQKLLYTDVFEVRAVFCVS